MTALILGGGSCVWDDVKALEQDVIGHEWPGLVMAVNDIGCHWRRRLDHWCTLHPRNIGRWMRERQARGFPGRAETWSFGYPRLVDHNTHQRAAGSSGLFAVYVAKEELGVDRAVLCGMPQTPTPHFRESRVHMEDSPWMPADHHWDAWLSVADDLRGFLRSMSGRTRELFGAPTREWLHG